jgi:hypothetical protein
MERDYSNRSCNTCCFDTNGKCDISKKTGCVSNTNDWNDKDYWASKLDDESDAVIYKEKLPKKYEDKLVAKDVEIRFGEHQQTQRGHRKPRRRWQHRHRMCKKLASRTEIDNYL